MKSIQIAVLQMSKLCYTNKMMQEKTRAEYVSICGGNNETIHY